MEPLLSRSGTTVADQPLTLADTFAPEEAS